MNFDELKKKHNHLIIQTCYKYAFLLTQDELNACIDSALWKCYLDYDDSRGDFDSWLKLCIRWECCELINRNRCRECYLEDLDESPSEDFSFNSILINELLDNLTNIEKSVIIAKFFDGKTQKEIAEEFGYSRQGIKAIVERALKKMESGV
jgi:RNA polymerase sigma factor (sigma-70 family)